MYKNTFYRRAFVGLLPKFECSISCLSMCLSLVFQTQNKVQSLGRISESFSQVTAENKYGFMNTTFTEKVLYAHCIWCGKIPFRFSGGLTL